MELDTIGGYYYEPGYCVRDAFRQALGGCWADSWYPYACPVSRIRDFCARHGYPCEIGHAGFPARQFRIGTRIVWVVARDGSTTEGHAVYQPDPREVLKWRDWGDLVICGYALLER